MITGCLPANRPRRPTPAVNNASTYYNKRVNSWDVVITGAGIIGVSLALELRERGAKVLVLDRGEPGGEASSAAAGMLAPDDPETPPALRPLALESARMFPAYVHKLEKLSKIATDFRRHGTIAFGHIPSVPPSYKKLLPDELHHREPLLRSNDQPAFFVAENSVDPHLLMRAALSAARNLALEIRANSPVRETRSLANQVEVVTDSGTFVCRAAVNCQGAWSGAPVRPRKGQMLYVQTQTVVLKHVIRAPEVYIVPRSTGKALVGATVEDAGYDKTVEPETIKRLLAAAAKYLPELASAPITQSWAGLRPGTPDDLPILGRTDMRGVFIASGHFRNGILLAPVTAAIMADLLTSKAPSLNISAFAPSRFAPARANQR